MSSDPSDDAIDVYGSAISYYTGKLEGYLRYKEIPYRFIPLSPSHQRRLHRETGAAQVPAVKLPDGRWMTDTTPMIDWFEAESPQPTVIPADPVQSFFCRLIEDYAEEWLWRPAMHYRWSYRGDALLSSRRIAEEILVEVPAPGFLKRFVIRQRQFRGWVKGDGVTRETRDHVEGCYLKMLDQLSAIFARRPFLFGQRPSLADFGFFAPIFRHYSQDPTPAEIMRQRGPAVFEWQARLWNARASESEGGWVEGIPDDLGPILDEIGSAYLPYLCANAEGWKAGQRRHDALIQGVPYCNLPVSQYRVWCLERLREHFEGLPGAAKQDARKLLEAHDCWEPLWRIESPDSGYASESVPFRGHKVHYQNARAPAS